MYSDSSIYQRKHNNRKKGFWATAFEPGQKAHTLWVFLLLPIFLMFDFRLETDISSGAQPDAGPVVIWFARILMFALILWCVNWIFNPVMNIGFIRPLTADLLEMGKTKLQMCVAAFLEFVVAGCAYLHSGRMTGYVLLCVAVGIILYLTKRLMHIELQDLRSCSLDDVDI